MGHQSSGKTMVAEAMLFAAGVTSRIGNVEDGNTVMDSSPDEIERKISITAALACCEYAKTKINILDTPGYEDFIGEVVSCLPVVEGAVIVVSADAGIEVGTEKSWQNLDAHTLPRIVCVNKLDKEHSDFEKCVADAQKFLGSKVMPIQLPIGQGDGFKGVVDLLAKKAYIYQDPGKFTEDGIPEDLSGTVDEWRQKLMDFAAETDDTLLEKFFSEGTLSDEELTRGLSMGVTAGTLVPLVCCAAPQGIGIHQLMNTIVSMLPSPEWRKQIAAKSAVSGETQMIDTGPGEPTCCFVYKGLSEKHIGDLTFIKVFGGQVKVGEELFNANIDSSERIGQLYFIQGKNRVETDVIEAGDIGAAVKLKSAKVNNTLCDKTHAVILPEIEFPEPTLHTAIVPRSKSDVEKVGTGLNRLNEEDPTFKVEIDPELRQTVLSGQGELHFEVILARLKRKHQVEVDMVAPKIPYRETITAAAEAQGKYKKQSGGRGQYGDVWLKLEPLPRSTGFEFVNAIVGGAVPSKYIPAVEKGVKEAMKQGVIAGFSVMDIKVTLYDGSFHTVDSSDNAFKVAGSLGFKKAVQQAKPVILEPIINVEVLVPEDFMGDVMGDLSMRRGKIQGTEQEKSYQKIKAQVPLSELHRYSTSLRSMTQGRAMHRRSFSHYEHVPHDIAQKLIAEAEAAKEEGN